MINYATTELSTKQSLCSDSITLQCEMADVRQQLAQYMADMQSIDAVIDNCVLALNTIDNYNGSEKQALTIINCHNAMENLLGIAASKITTAAAQEGLGEAIKNMWNKLVEFVKKIWAKITGFFKKSGEPAIKTLEEKTTQVEKKIKEPELKLNVNHKLNKPLKYAFVGMNTWSKDLAILASVAEESSKRLHQNLTDEVAAKYMEWLADKFKTCKLICGWKIDVENASGDGTVNITWQNTITADEGSYSTLKEAGVSSGSDIAKIRDAMLAIKKFMYRLEELPDISRYAENAQLDHGHAGDTTFKPDEETDKQYPQTRRDSSVMTIRAAIILHCRVFSLAYNVYRANYRNLIEILSAVDESVEKVNG